LYELLVLADLRRRGFSIAKIRALLDILKSRFGVRLYDAIGDGDKVTLLTDGRDIYAKTASGDFYNLLGEPNQPLLVLGKENTLKALSSRISRRRKKRKSKRVKQAKKTVASR
jgi:DNA-binding transcriptional MerR regulator|tara:strand:- start:531 stop:869 length:339 start_codon:yes stop_codon:yes gene_type:complete